MQIKTDLDSLEATLSPANGVWGGVTFGFFFLVVALPFAAIGYSGLLGIEPLNIWGDQIFGSAIFALLGTTHSTVGIASMLSPLSSSAHPMHHESTRGPAAAAGHSLAHNLFAPVRPSTGGRL